ncbi:protein phosphatase 1 regulatory subunit 35 [Chamaea fasciata]|uniref:protein phosphatase 1 regulatory subunit 35 n=1 Tax=Chamaea fasciata TaxID=190680 RepID=UPI003369CFDB
MRPRAVPPPPPPPPPPGGILRRGGHGGGNRQVRFVLRDEEEEDDDEDRGAPAPAVSALATPTLHSSRGGPGGGPRQPFDAPRAAAALLGSSFTARSALGGAAAAAMNVPPAQRLFRGLVSLAVPPPPGPRRAGVPAPPAPLPQVPGPQLGVLVGAAAGGRSWPWLPPPAPPEPPRALPRPPGAAFTMYHKLQQWGGC